MAEIDKVKAWEITERARFISKNLLADLCSSCKHTNRCGYADEIRNLGNSIASDEEFVLDALKTFTNQETKLRYKNQGCSIVDAIVQGPKNE